MNVNWKFKLCALLLSWCYVSASVAGSNADIDRLIKFYDEVKSLKADFVQRVGASGFNANELSKGVFYLQRPRYFRWDYSEPYQQQIVADGEHVWIYDVDMDQVVVKKLDAVLGNTPAVLLSGSKELKQQFLLSPLSELQGRDPSYKWAMLKPKDKESNYKHIILGFDKNNLKAMELLDSFDQLTIMKFSNVQRNPKLDAGIFRFIPPVGVDVIGSEEVLGQ